MAGLRILVVDDNETNRFILEEQLAGWNIEAAIAASGVEGLGLLDDAHRREVPFDIVLLDYVMPGVNGEQFARMVRGDGRFADTRIILLTSAMDLDPEVLTAAGINVSLTKPVLPSSLLDTLANVAGDRAETQAANGGADGAPARAGSRAPAGSRGHVLVVEDNEVNQLVAVGILESLGYAVTVAENGLAGYYAFQSGDGSFDAVLMDCQMPQMDGYDSTRMIRSFEDGQYRTPIIAMTAAAIAGERERCLESGMDDFLTKPVDVTLLRETLDRWVPHRRATPRSTTARRTAAGSPPWPTPGCSTRPGWRSCSTSTRATRRCCCASSTASAPTPAAPWPGCARLVRPAPPPSSAAPRTRSRAARPTSARPGWPSPVQGGRGPRRRRRRRRPAGPGAGRAGARRRGEGARVVRRHAAPA